MLPVVLFPVHSVPIKTVPDLQASHPLHGRNKTLSQISMQISTFSPLLQGRGDAEGLQLLLLTLVRILYTVSSRLVTVNPSKLDLTALRQSNKYIKQCRNTGKLSLPGWSSQHVQHYCLKHNSLLCILLLTYVYKAGHNKYYHCVHHECIMAWATVCSNIRHPLGIPVTAT